MGKWIASLLTAMMIFGMPVQAQQGTGQFCVRAYQDDNGNMMRDPGEPLLQAGIVVSLHDMRGVVIGTALLDNSPTREQGLVCFNNLPDGQYAIFVDSVLYRATTTENMIARLSTTSQLAVLEYGGQRIQRPASQTLTPLAPEKPFQPNWERVIVAAIWGSAAAMLVGTIGLFLHVAFIRPHNRRVMRQRPLTPYNTPPVAGDYFRPPPEARRNYFEYEDTSNV